MFKLLLCEDRNKLTEAILSRAVLSEAEKRAIILVPEQRSHVLERKLCEIGGDAASLHAEVLTFSRLTQRVFQELGGSAVPVLSAGGRVLMMHQAVRRLSQELQVFRRSKDRAGFLTELLATADECKSCRISPELLLTAAEQGNYLRLRELGMILGAYDTLTAERAEDPRDRLTRLAETPSLPDWLQNRSVFLLGFTDFTPQEKQVISVLFRGADEVTAGLRCDTLDLTGEDIFAPPRRTALGLIALAGGQGIETEYEILPAESHTFPELHLLADQLFSDLPEPMPSPVACIFTAEERTPHAELERVAEEILRLVREEGFRFRDIAVAPRNMKDWEGRIENVFGRYGIPIFLSRMDDILQKPVLSLITAALDTAAGNYEYDDIFRYLKTGLAGVDRERTDELENYVLRWDIRGGQWTSEKEWSRHPGGYGCKWTEEDHAQVARFDALRREIITPLEHLRHADAQTGQDWARAVYRFLEEINLPGTIRTRAEELSAAGKLQEAEEMRQIWAVLIEALEQCSDLLSEDEMNLSGFAELFHLVLSQAKVGSIPISLDRVTCGDMPRICHGSCRVLFLIGADDENLPCLTPTAGLLTDEDRAVLSDCGAETALDSDGRLEREMLLIYEACTLPEERLYISCADHAANGAARRPSFLFSRLKELFPAGLGSWPRADTPSAMAPAMDFAAARGDRIMLRDLAALPGGETADMILSAMDVHRENLSPAAVETLYGKKLHLSASRMDKVKSCHYAYFLQYGLKAEERKSAGLDAPEAGTFVHYVLEYVLRACREAGGVRKVSEADAARLSREATERYIREEMGGMADKTPRFCYLFRRLADSALRVVENMIDELRCSDFEPIAFELGFGDGRELPPIRLETDGITVSVSGIVDRVDGWLRNDRLYLRVTDYKTGKKSFKLADIWYGLNLQMLLYLFALQENGLPGDTHAVTPAGVLYVPAREEHLSGRRGMTEEARRHELDDKLRRSGLILDDPDVLAAMEHVPPGGDTRFLPVRVSKKTGEFICRDRLASAAQLSALRQHIRRILRDIAREIGQGNIQADPWFRNETDTACRFCAYASACHFEEGYRGEHMRYLASMKNADFWKILNNG